MLRREPAARPAGCRRELYLEEVSQRVMELASSSGALENVAPASDMHSASYRQRTLGEHNGAALANLFQVACNGLRYTSTGNVDDGH